jgi:hypothetical protein
MNPLELWSLDVRNHPTMEGMEEVVATNKMNPSQNFQVPTTRVNGIHHMGGCKQERWEYLNTNTKYKPGDILIVSYPKCGTTWSEQSVLLLLNGGNPNKLNPRFKNSYTTEQKDKPGKIWIETMIDQDPEVQKRMGDEGRPLTWQEFDEVPSPRVIKTHAPVHLLLGCQGKGLESLPDYVKVIVVSRNPLDACVSSYYHAHNPYKMGWPFEAWATVWYHGRCAFGSYFDWIKGWYDQSKQYPNRVCWIEYETMKQDQATALTQLGEYLGLSVSHELIENVVNFSSFDHMKKQTEEHGGDTLNHLRKGTVGDWKNHFSKELYEVFAEKFGCELKSTGLYFPPYEI